MRLWKYIADRYKADLDYYASLNKNFERYYSDQVQESLSVLQRLSQVAREFDQTDLYREIDDSLMTYIEVFGLM